MDTVIPDSPEPQQADVPEPTFDYAAWIKSMTVKQRKAYIDTCLDEFEATAESVRHSKCTDAASIKMAKAWGERQKKHLKMLGYRKRMSVIGGKRVKPGTVEADEPKEGED